MTNMQKYYKTIMNLSKIRQDILYLNKNYANKKFNIHNENDIQYIRNILNNYDGFIEYDEKSNKFNLK
jgi:hypothetical protein